MGYMVRANSMQKFAYFCFSDFKPKLPSQIVALTTILLSFRIQFQIILAFTGDLFGIAPTMEF